MGYYASRNIDEIQKVFKAIRAVSNAVLQSRLWHDFSTASENNSRQSSVAQQAHLCYTSLAWVRFRRRAKVAPKSH